ncbi:MAG: hypothetical protein WKF30_18095 [Pyrinomonadaceae bacterium]
MSATTSSGGGRSNALENSPQILGAAEVPITAPLRNLGLTLALTLATLAAVGAAWGVVGYEMLIVAMGWPHVILGFIFNFGKVLRGESGTRASFALLTLLTLFFWSLHYLFALTALIYVYFLYHAFRDEIAIYLNTRSGPAGRAASVYSMAGVAPLILLMLVVPQPAAFRQDLRRVELTGADLLPYGGWALLAFRPIENSRGREFYFTLQAPHTEGMRAFTTLATPGDSREAGEMRVGDERWPGAADLHFQPFYAGESREPPGAAKGGFVPVLLTGGHRVGQTFTAERDNLSGVWMPLEVLEDDAHETRFLFRLASPALLPLSPAAANVRFLLICALGFLVLWRLVPQLKVNRELWSYLAVFVLLFAILQAGLKASARAGYVVPMIFQFVVVFHYWSWYVFSFKKTRRAVAAAPPGGASLYDRMLARLRHRRSFLTAVITLNAASGLCAFYFYQATAASSPLRFFLDYHYFLYILVLHVTFSFAPRGATLKAWMGKARQS